MITSLTRRFIPEERPELLKPGMYSWMSAEDITPHYRLHLRIERDGTGVLIVNASTVLHLNQTAAEYAKLVVEDANVETAGKTISSRYRIKQKDAEEDYRAFHDHVTTLATNPDLDPVLYLDMDRTEPYTDQPSAPYRLDCALTYMIDQDGTMDPLAGKRVDRELTTSEWIQILDKAWEAGIPHVTFTGGEPTLREDLIDLIRHAENIGQVAGLLTNARRLVEREYVEALEQTGLDHFLVVYHPNFPEGREGLIHALDSDVYTAVHLTLTPEWHEQVFDVLKDLAELGVPAVSLSSSERNPTLAKALSSARDHAAELDLRLVWDVPAPYSASNPIALVIDEPKDGAGLAWMYVEPDGDVLPAQEINRVLGNMLTTPWEEIEKNARA
ncbi:MAG: radical SAM protein [Anaerolineales bacterium]